MFSRDRLLLEWRVRQVLAAIADRVRGGNATLTATHPQTYKRFSPDPTLIEDLLGSDRSRSQITTASGVIRNLRVALRAAPDPNQPELKLERHHAPEAPAGVEPTRWRVLWGLYEEHVRAVGEEHKRKPTRDDDDKWQRKMKDDGVKIGGVNIDRKEQREVRRMWRDNNTC
jgi:hypothetical protein